MHGASHLKPAEYYISSQHRPRLKPPPLKRTSPLAWFAAICCALLWTVIILGGLAVLIVYLLIRPRNPRLEIPQATLNAAYLDVDTGSSAAFLNADLTILANFSNPNRRIDVAFGMLDLDLYFGGALLAATAVEPFAERRGESVLKSVHLVASQVALSEAQAEKWRKQVEEGKEVLLELRSALKTTSRFGGFLSVTYWLRSRCRVLMGAPPGGMLKAVSCRIKR